jgi:DNA polymerase-3 subunit beta
VPSRRNLILFEAETFSLGSRLLEGTFPNFAAIVPKTHVTAATVETRQFADLLHSVAPFARDNSNIVTITLTPDTTDTANAGTMQCQAAATDVGEAKSTMPAGITGPALTSIILNLRYLTDILSVIAEDHLTLEFTSANRPAVLHPSEDREVVHLIMPMSTNR